LAGVQKLHPKIVGLSLYTIKPIPAQILRDKAYYCAIVLSVSRSPIPWNIAGEAVYC
jgi:hypothetical protein